MKRHGHHGWIGAIGLALVVFACDRKEEPATGDGSKPAPSSPVDPGKDAAGTETRKVVTADASADDTPKTNAAPEEKREPDEAVPANGVLEAGKADGLVPVGGRAKVELVDAGPEPREQLQYALAVGKASKMQLDTDMTMTMTMGGRGMPATKVPRMTLQMDMNVTEAKDGDFAIRASVTQATMTADPSDSQQAQIVAAVQPELAALEGLAMDFWISPQGHTRDLVLDIPPTISESIKPMLQGLEQSIASAAAPLPTEPVGVGARWRVTTRVASGGADLLQYGDFHLVSRDGDTIKVEVKIKQLAAKDTMEPPGMPPGTSVHLTSIDSNGAGETTIDLGELAPVTGRMQLESKMAMNVDAMGQKLESGVEMTMLMQFSRPGG